jgi:outer membrane biosynthesis protein TonB
LQSKHCKEPNESQNPHLHLKIKPSNGREMMQDRQQNKTKHTEITTHTKQMNTRQQQNNKITTQTKQQKNNKNKHQERRRPKTTAGEHTPAEQKMGRMESEGGQEARGGGGEVSCTGHGAHAPACEIHAQTRGTHAPAGAMLESDWAAALGSRGAGDDDGTARVSSGSPQ